MPIEENPYEIGVNCLIVDVSNGHEDYDSTIVVSPIGTDLIFSVEGGFGTKV